MNTEEITRIAQQIIFSHEGGYGSVNKNDNGALSVGRCQWHAGRALSLLRKICKADPAASTILGSLYAEIMNVATNWGYRVASDDEAGKKYPPYSKQRREKPLRTLRRHLMWEHTVITSDLWA